MAVVDYERAWLALKAKVGEKRSWGTDQIHVAMNEIEVECYVAGEEGFDTGPIPLRQHGDNIASPEPRGRTMSKDGAPHRPTTPAAA